MVRTGEPHGSVFYCCMLLFGLLAAAMFTSEVFTGVLSSLGERLLAAGVALVFWCGVLLAFERLVRPDAALERSLTLSPAVRQTLNTLRRVAQALVALGIIGSGALHLIGGAWKDTATDVGEFSGVIVFAAWGISDVCGEKLSARPREFTSRPE